MALSFAASSLFPTEATVGQTSLVVSSVDFLEPLGEAEKLTLITSQFKTSNHDSVWSASDSQSFRVHSSHLFLDAQLVQKTKKSKNDHD